MKFLIRPLILLIAIFNSLIGYSIEPEWALYGISGNDFNGGIASSYSVETRLSGYINANGEVVIPYKFKSVRPFNRGFAIVTEQSGENGIIDVKGNYTLPPGDYSIRELDEAPGFFNVERKSDGKCSVFNGRNFITSFDYDYINFYDNYPFLGLSSKDHTNGARGILNILTGQFFPQASVYRLANLGFVVEDSNNQYVFTSNGDPINLDKYLLSSKGNEVYFDESKRLCGIRNAKTKAVVSSPKYLLSKNNVSNRIWINDAVILYDSISPLLRRAAVVINQDGKELFRQKDNYTYEFDDDFIKAFERYVFNDDASRYYDFSGKEITEMRGKMWIQIAPHVYRGDNTSKLYFAKDGIFKDGVDYPFASDNQIIYRKSDTGKYYIHDIDTHKELGPYEYVSGERFSEGLVKVDNGSGYFFIDKNGNEFHYPSYIKINGDKFSEGVVSAYDDNEGIYGYIYNPLGHGSWRYNQKAGNIGDYAFHNLANRAHELFEKEQYSQAMDIYSQLMMLKSEESFGFDNYAACLYNLGYYDEALTAVEVSLSHWPTNQYALDLQSKTISALEREREIEEEQERIAEQESYNNSNKNSMSIWDAIGAFANILTGATSQYPNDYYTPSYSIGSNNSFSNNAGGGNLELQYRNWERRAESNYNSLTNTGYSSTTKSGNKRGSTGQGMSSGNYVQMKRCLREAQQEMRNIRQKAARAGINIPKSHWENASVGY